MPSLRPSSGREHTIVQLIQSGDDDYSMNETRRNPTSGTEVVMITLGLRI